LLDPAARAVRHTLSLHDALPIWAAGSTQEVADLLEGPRVQDVGRGEPGSACRADAEVHPRELTLGMAVRVDGDHAPGVVGGPSRSEEHTSELQSRFDLVCRLLPE